MTDGSLTIMPQRTYLIFGDIEGKLETCFASNAPRVPERAATASAGRFCSDRCREHYDAGERRVEPFDPFKVTKWRVIAGDNPGYLVATPMQSRSDGWNVTCRGCGKQFESKGRAFCSKDCKEQSAERETNAAEMAEVGMDLPTKRCCQAPGCSDHIPNWRNGRRVSQNSRFCSARCKASRTVRPLQGHEVARHRWR